MMALMVALHPYGWLPWPPQRLHVFADLYIIHTN